MNEERKQLLENLLSATIADIQLSISYPTERSLSIEEYRILYYDSNIWSSNHQRRIYRHRTKPVIKNKLLKNKLLDFMRYELAEYIDGDRIDCATVTSYSDLDPTSLSKLLKDILIIAIVFSIKEAILNFEKWLVVKHVDFQRILLLSGIKINEEIQVYDGLKLMPLPSSSSALSRIDILPEIWLGPEEIVSSLGGKTLAVLDCITEPRFANPKSRLIKRDPFRAFKSRMKENIELENFNYKEFFWNLSLCCKHPIIYFRWWDHVNQWEPLAPLYGGDGTGMDGFESGHFTSSYTISKDNVNNAKESYQKFKKLPQQVREKLLIAIPRWLRSKSGGLGSRTLGISFNPINEGLVDRAIDLGIAFESIYSDSNIKQLSYTFRTRVAWYLGKNLDERKEYMNLFKEIYNCRSNAVHKGRLSNTIKVKGRNKPVETKLLLDEADELCFASIVKVIDEGRFPDWETLVLGDN